MFISRDGGAKGAGEAAEHVHDCFCGDAAWCGVIVVFHVSDIDEFEGGVLVCGDDVGGGGWWCGEGC